MIRTVDKESKRQSVSGVREEGVWYKKKSLNVTGRKEKEGSYFKRSSLKVDAYGWVKTHNPLTHNNNKKQQTLYNLQFFRD